MDIPEIRKQFQCKYGREFEEVALRNAWGVVNERVASKLSVQPPSVYLVQVYLETIADEHWVKWKPKVLLKASEMYEPTRAPESINASAPLMPSHRTMMPRISRRRIYLCLAKRNPNLPRLVKAATTRTATISKRNCPLKYPIVSDLETREPI